MGLKPKSLYYQLLLIVSAIVSITIAAFGYFTAKKQSQYIFSGIKQQSIHLANNMALICADYIIVNDYAGMEIFLLRTTELPDVLGVQVIDKNGNVLADIVHAPGSSPTAKFDTKKADVPASLNTSVLIENKNMLVYQPILAGSHLGWVKITHSLEPITQVQRTIWKNTLFAGILGILISFVLIAGVIKPPANAIKRLGDFARRLNELKGEQIQVEHGAIEIEQLSKSLNYASLELHDTERKLIAERKRLEVTLYSIGDAVIATDKDGRITLMNKIAEELTGYTREEAVGMPLQEVFHIINEKTREPAENPVKRVLETGRIEGLANHTALISKDGTERSIADSAAPITDETGEIFGVVMVFRDITEKQKMEEELLKAKKLESIGILAGGIAHDFNNILTAILGNISLAMNFSTPEDSIYKRLKSAEKATERAMDLAQQLLTFAKGGAPVLKTESIGNLINETVHFILRGSDIKCNISIPDDLWLAEVDTGQMSQVIQNIVINAQQAMPEGGIINVKAENITINEKSGLPLDSGDYIRIIIQDTGTGISEEHLSKIFDPYFSTKKTGSGLGLAIAYSIVKKHNGHITVESRVGVGTTFYVYIPASQKQILHLEEKKEEMPSITGKGKLLIMDDEEIVREVAGEMLKHMGYEVEFAIDGGEAIELYKKAKEEGEPFDAVILDLTIPGGMGGRETIEKLLEIDPHVTAIVSSGYSNDPVMANFRKYGFKSVVTKPYKLNEMREALAEAMRTK